MSIERVDQQTGIQQAGGDVDSKLIAQWLADRKPHTRRAYSADVARFRSFIGDKPLATVTAGDVLAFKAALVGADRTRNRALSAVKSLLSYGYGIGILPVNVGAVVKLAKPKDTLAERVLSQDEVKAIIAAASSERDRRALVMLAGTGVRVAELVSLRWRDVLAVNGGAVLTVYGKGDKTRRVKLSGWLWDELRSWRGDADADELLFPLSTRTVHRIVATAAERAGLKSKVSPHWFRHAYATLAIAGGAPLHAVQQALGHSSLAVTGIYLELVGGEGAADYLPDLLTA